jgi:glutaredoxin
VHVVFELDLMGEQRNGDVQQILGKLTGVTSVPNVIVSGTSIGGGDDVTGLHNAGKLIPLLKEAGCEFQ